MEEEKPPKKKPLLQTPMEERPLCRFFKEGKCQKVWLEMLLTVNNTCNFIHVCLTLYHTIQLLTTVKERAFENNVGKGENAGTQHFLIFLQYFQPYQK